MAMVNAHLNVLQFPITPGALSTLLFDERRYDFEGYSIFCSQSVIPPVRGVFLVKQDVLFFHVFGMLAVPDSSAFLALRLELKGHSSVWRKSRERQNFLAYAALFALFFDHGEIVHFF